MVVIPSLGSSSLDSSVVSGTGFEGDGDTKSTSTMACSPGGSIPLQVQSTTLHFCVGWGEVVRFAWEINWSSLVVYSTSCRVATLLAPPVAGP